MIKTIAEILIGFVAALHIYILWLEMFAWNTKGRKTFKSFPVELFEKTTPMAANQGLYNGFLAAGLIWSLLINDFVWSNYVACFFLWCVIIAGIFGAYTVQKSIFFVQSFPAILAFIFLMLS